MPQVVAPAPVTVTNVSGRVRGLGTLTSRYAESVDAPQHNTRPEGTIPHAPAPPAAICVNRVTTLTSARHTWTPRRATTSVPPPRRGVTLPVESTTATVVSELDHVARPVSPAPLTVNATTSPQAIDAVAGVTTRSATGVGTSVVSLAVQPVIATTMRPARASVRML